MSQQILILGSGITGLISAYWAVRVGYQVCLISKSPDPRTCPSSTFESSTWNGFINRYITLTEGHPYLNLSGYISTMYPNIDKDFLLDLTQGGMLALPLKQWNALSAQFLKERFQCNQESSAILQLFLEYLDENRASLQMWYSLLQEVITSDPGLINSLSLHYQGIDRLYDAADLFENALSSQQKQQIVKKSFDVQQLFEQEDFIVYQPGLKLQNSFIRGGLITVYGLAFDVKVLGCWLLNWLDSRGVKLHLGSDYDVVAIEQNAAGRVSGLRTRTDKIFTAKHILLHPGAYISPQVLANTPAYGKIGGVKGLWARIRNAQHLFGSVPPRPNKIHGGKYEVKVNERSYSGQLVDLNVMPQVHPDGSWDLIIGSGYLFVGLHPFQGERQPGIPLSNPLAEQQHQAQIVLAEELVFRAFMQVVSRIYNLSIDIDQVLAGQHEFVDLPSKGCIRSWTPDDRELRTILPTADGGVLLIDAGGNTGSTTKAPFVSCVALEFLRSIDAGIAPTEQTQLESHYEAIRARHRRSNTDLTVCDWQQLEESLGRVVKAANQ